MRKILTTSFIAILILSSASALIAQDQAKVLLVPREGKSGDLELMLTKEVGVMRTLLEEAGYQVVVASESGGSFTSDTMTLEPDLTLDEVQIDDYVGIIMPCMAMPNDPVSLKAIELAKQAASTGKAIAAQFGSVFILAQAGILKGKKYALWYDPKVRDDARFQGGTYMGKGVVRDGNIVTSGTCPYMAKASGEPDGTPELTKSLIQVLSKK